MGYLDCHHPGCGGLVDTSEPETNAMAGVTRSSWMRRSKQKSPVCNAGTIRRTNYG